MKIKLGLWVALVLLLTLFSPERDWMKFFFTGKSGTYNVQIVKHSDLVVFSLGFLLVGLMILHAFYSKHKGVQPAKVVVALLWLLSLRLYAVVDDAQPVVVSGFSFIPFSSCAIPERNWMTSPCTRTYDVFLRHKLEAKVNKVAKRHAGNTAAVAVGNALKAGTLAR